MSAIASSRADRWLFPAWAAFATANTVAMFILPGAETVPFHFVWISLTLVYGFQTWSLRRTYLVVAVVSVVTGAALVLHVRNQIIGVEETTEVPLMAAVFLAVVWHVRRRNAALREAGELAASEHAVREAQRRFVRLASHELRTPLTVARGYAELIRDGSANPQVGADAEIVLDELEKLNGISARLLTLAQIDERSTLPQASVNIDELILRTVKRWRPTATRHWAIDTHAGTITAVRERLEAALDSLLDNAVRFSEDGGRIELVAYRGGGSVVIEVRDDGLGIPAEELGYIFESFRSGTARGGTGMGLAIVKAVVDAHGGEVGARSSVPGGTVISMRLPITQPESSAQPSDVARSHAAPTVSATVGAGLPAG
jgi:two-component system, OmpR family, sensor kinase